MKNTFNSKYKSSKSQINFLDTTLETYKIAKEDIDRDIKAENLCIKYAILSLFSSEKILEDFEEDALDYLLIGEEPPEEIKQKLIDTLEERKERNKRNGCDT